MYATFPEVREQKLVITIAVGYLYRCLWSAAALTPRTREERLSRETRVFSNHLLSRVGSRYAVTKGKSLNSGRVMGVSLPITI